MDNSTNAVPRPGSGEALARGCKCPVLDNSRGLGIPFGGGQAWYVTEGCPVHAPVTTFVSQSDNSENT